MKAIDFHVHLPTPEWLDVSMKGYVEAAESYFRSKVARKTLDELASEYDAMDVMAVGIQKGLKRGEGHCANSTRRRRRL